MTTDNSNDQEASSTPAIVYLLIRNASHMDSHRVEGVTFVETVAQQWVKEKSDEQRGNHGSGHADYSYEPFRAVTSVRDVAVAQEERRVAAEVARFKAQCEMLSPEAKRALNLA